MGKGSVEQASECIRQGKEEMNGLDHAWIGPLPERPPNASFDLICKIGTDVQSIENNKKGFAGERLEGLSPKRVCSRNVITSGGVTRGYGPFFRSE